MATGIDTFGYRYGASRYGNVTLPTTRGLSKPAVLSPDGAVSRYLDRAARASARQAGWAAKANAAAAAWEGEKAFMRWLHIEEVFNLFNTGLGTYWPGLLVNDCGNGAGQFPYPGGLPCMGVIAGHHVYNPSSPPAHGPLGLSYSTMIDAGPWIGGLRFMDTCQTYTLPNDGVDRYAPAAYPLPWAGGRGDAPALPSPIPYPPAPFNAWGANRAFRDAVGWSSSGYSIQYDFPGFGTLAPPVIVTVPPRVHHGHGTKPEPVAKPWITTFVPGVGGHVLSKAGPMTKETKVGGVRYPVWMFGVVGQVTEAGDFLDCGMKAAPDVLPLKNRNLGNKPMSALRYMKIKSRGRTSDDVKAKYLYDNWQNIDGAALFNCMVMTNLSDTIGGLQGHAELEIVRHYGGIPVLPSTIGKYMSGSIKSLWGM